MRVVFDTNVLISALVYGGQIKQLTFTGQPSLSVGHQGAALMMTAMPAQAAWKSYINRQLGFSFVAPGEVKTDNGNFRGAIAGPRQSIVYRSVEDNIEYKVTVMSFLQS